MQAEAQPSVILSLACLFKQVNAFAMKPLPFSCQL
jgi:hypothetical protein